MSTSISRNTNHEFVLTRSAAREFEKISSTFSRHSHWPSTGLGFRPKTENFQRESQTETKSTRITPSFQEGAYVLRATSRVHVWSGDIRRVIDWTVTNPICRRAKRNSPVNVRLVRPRPQNRKITAPSARSTRRIYGPTILFETTRRIVLVAPSRSSDVVWRTRVNNAFPTNCRKLSGQRCPAFGSSTFISK